MDKFHRKDNQHGKMVGIVLSLICFALREFAARLSRKSTFVEGFKQPFLILDFFLLLEKVVRRSMQWFVPGEAPVCSLSMQLKRICSTTLHESPELTKMEGRVFSAP